MERNKTALKKRREKALNRLENQLKQNSKFADKKRINKEIEILKARI